METLIRSSDTLPQKDLPTSTIDLPLEDLRLVDLPLVDLSLVDIFPSTHCTTHQRSTGQPTHPIPHITLHTTHRSHVHQAH